MKKLFLTSSIPVVCYVDGAFIGQPNNKSPKLISISDGKHFLEVQSLERGRLPRVFELDTSAKRLGVDPKDKSAVVIAYANGWRIELKDEIFDRLPSPTEAVAHAETNYKSVPYRLTVLYDGGFNALIDDGKSVKRHPLPSGLTNISTKLEVVDSSLISAVTARVRGRQYLYVAVMRDNVWATKIDAAAAQVQQREGKTYILLEHSDIARRGTVNVYDSKSFDFIESYSVYMSGSSETTTDPSLVPVAMFEAVKSNDRAEIERYLTPSLKSDSSIEDLLGYLSPYEYIIPDTYPDGSIRHLLIDSDGNAKQFKFELLNGLIDNIVELQTAEITE